MVAPLGPYTPAVRAGDYLFCSGQLGLDGEDLADGIENQTRYGIANLKKLLEENGASLSDVAKTTVFLTDMDDFAAMNEVYAAQFGDHKPARSTVAVAALPKGACFEIEATAYVV